MIRLLLRGLDKRWPSRAVRQGPVPEPLPCSCGDENGLDGRRHGYRSRNSVLGPRGVLFRTIGPDPNLNELRSYPVSSVPVNTVARELITIAWFDTDTPGTRWMSRKRASLSALENALEGWKIRAQHGGVE